MENICNILPNNYYIKVIVCHHCKDFCFVLMFVNTRLYFHFTGSASLMSI